MFKSIEDIIGTTRDKTFEHCQRRSSQWTKQFNNMYGYVSTEEAGNELATPRRRRYRSRWKRQRRKD